MKIFALWHEGTRIIKLGEETEIADIILALLQ